MKHPHAELMMMYAQDAMETDKPWERWQERANERDDWVDAFSPVIFWGGDRQYRRKPKSQEEIDKEAFIKWFNAWFDETRSDNYYYAWKAALKWERDRFHSTGVPVQGD